MIPLEDIARRSDFTRLCGMGGVSLDLRYAGSNNFSGMDLYAGLDCAWLRLPAAQGLRTAALWLDAHHPGHRLRVLDALRPQRVQERIWQQVAGTPAQHYFADPAIGSIHSFGMAVDVTVLDPQGRECDMGSAFDETASLSHPALEAEHLAAGLLSSDQVSNRLRLRQAMQAAGFKGIDSEWWHFDHGDRARVRREMQRVY